MKKSITSKIVRVNIMLVLIALGSVYIIFSLVIRGYLYNQLQKTLENDTKTIIKLLREETGGEQIKDRELQNKDKLLFKLVKGQLETNVAVINISPKKQLGKVSYIYTTTSLTDQNLKTIQDAIYNKDSFFKLRIEDIDYLATARKFNGNKSRSINKKAQHESIVVSYTDISNIKLFEKMIALMMLAITVVVALLTFVIAGRLSKRITIPILNLVHWAKKVSDRNFNEEITISTQDEIQDLAEAFNGMSESIIRYDNQQKEFFQNISHEIKTPLMAIQGYAEGIQENIFENNEQALIVIVEESKRIKNIVEDMIYLSRLDSIEQDQLTYISCDMNEIISQAIQKIESIAIKQDIDIEFSPKQEIFATVDKEQMLRALINILSNCLKYTRSLIQIKVLQEDQWIRIEIRDNGNGLSKETIDKIFDRFYKGEKEGTGIGMCIVQGIIKKHGGMIIAGNHDQGGAEFVLKIPC